MAQRGLDGAHHQGRRPARRMKQLVQGAHLDGVPQRGAGAVHLQPADPPRVDASLQQRQPYHRPLAGPMRRRQRGGASVLIHRRRTQHSSKWPALTGQKQHQAGLRPDVAVTRCV